MTPAIGGTEAVERRALRQEYRELYQQSVAGKEQLEDAGSDALRTMLDKVESLCDKVEKPREAAVDADVLCHLTECGLAMVSRGHAANQGRTPAALVTLLRHAYGLGGAARGNGGAAPLAADELSWADLGGAAAAYARLSPGVGCMLGPLTAPAKQRAAPLAPRARRGAAGAGPVATARELDDAETGGGGEAHKQETDRNMLTMWGALNNRAGGEAAFAPLVLNRASFAQTVENIFTLSFLVRDRRVRLRRDAARGVIVTSTGPANAGNGGGGSGNAAVGNADGSAVQLMLSFGMAEWEAMAAMFADGECLMPHRAPASAVAGGGGGGGGGGGADAARGNGEAAAAKQKQQQKRARDAVGHEQQQQKRATKGAQPRRGSIDDHAPAAGKDQKSSTARKGKSNSGMMDMAPNDDVIVIADSDDE